MQKMCRKSWRFLVLLYHQFFENHCPDNAASLAYSTLLSIVPLMLFAFYILSFFPQLHGSGKQIEVFVLQHFVAGSATVIAEQLQNFSQHAHVLSWINVLSLGVISVLLIYNMVTSVNQIWRVRMQVSLALSFFIYWIFLLLAPIVFGLLLLLTSYITSLPMLSHVAKLFFIQKPLLLVFPLLVEWVIFTAMNWLLPSCRVKWSYACLAGFVTMVLFELAKAGFVQYLHYFPTYRLIYGALATIPIFLIWIYVSWLLILLGISICALLNKR